MIINISSYHQIERLPLFIQEYHVSFIISMLYEVAILSHSCPNSHQQMMQFIPYLISQWFG